MADMQKKNKKTIKPNHIYLIYIYIEDLALNNLKQLIGNKTQPNQTIKIFRSFKMLDYC